MIVAASGGSTSEDMNFATAEGLFYVNGIGDKKYEELAAMRGKLVRVFSTGAVPADAAPSRTPVESTDSLPFSTEPSEKVVLTLDQIFARLTDSTEPREVLKLSQVLADHAASDSVEEKYRVGELLSQCIDRNPECTSVLLDLCRSTNRQARFTGARCLSKLVERHPELVSREAVVALLERDIHDRSIPKLVARALGKGRHHQNIRAILQSIEAIEEYAPVVSSARSFKNDNQPRNYYEGR